MRITYYGHSCCSVKLKGKELLFDPFITPNPNASIKLEDVPADFIICTHGHVDHVADVKAIHDLTKARLVSNYEIVEWFGKNGVEDGIGLNTGGSCVIDDIRLKCFQAAHSSTLPDGSSGGHPNGYIVYSDEGNFYHAGDTALMLDMQLLADQELNFAFLPIGDHFTMGVDDAVKAAEFIAVDKVIGVHYDTFPPISIDKEEAIKAFSDKGKELILLDIGQTIEL